MMMKCTAILFVFAIFSPQILCQCPKGSDNCSTVVKPTNGTGPGTTTVTTYDNRAHVEAVSEATSKLTEAGLTYFLVTRPQLVTARNERMNHLEGRFTPIYEVLDVLAATDVPESPKTTSDSQKIMGYYLGEAWQDFLVDSPHLHGEAIRCLAEKRPDSNAKQRKFAYNPCSDVWRAAANPNASMTLTCLQPSLGAGKDMLCQDFNGEVSFVDGRLASLKLVVSRDWTDVLPDAIAKFGQPSGKDESNTLGIWKRDKYHIIAAKFDDRSAICWMTAEKYEESARTGRAILASQKESGNSLDR